MTGYDVTDLRLRCVLPFSAEPLGVRLIREAVGTQLKLWSLTAVAEEARLVATELATNVLKHVGRGTSAALVLESSETSLRIEAHDTGSRLPELMSAPPDQECGRGLYLLSALAEGWHATVTPMGKVVWFDLPLDSAKRCHRAERAVASLNGYRQVRGAESWSSRQGTPGLEESATDLIADLLHWVVTQGHDPDDILDRAQMHYEAESGAT